MKFSKAKKILREHGWLKRFVGPYEMHVARERGLCTEEEEDKSFKRWIENNLGSIIFRSSEFLFSSGDRRKSDLEIGNEIAKDIHYPKFTSRIFYIRSHINGSKKFSYTPCPIEDDESTFDKMRQMEAGERGIIFDAVIMIRWHYRTLSAVTEQDITVWILPKDFKLDGVEDIGATADKEE